MADMARDLLNQSAYLIAGAVVLMGLLGWVLQIMRKLGSVD